MKYLKHSGSLFLSLVIAGIVSPASKAATIFSGTGNDAAIAFQQMSQAIGGNNNNQAVGPQVGGFRTVNWDGVLLDGTDFGGNSQVIVQDKVVGIPEDRFLARGALYGDVYFVSGDGFESVNPNITNQFPAFSPDNTFAHSGEGENINEIEQSFTLAGTTTPAATRGFGAIFLDVEIPNTSSIEFFNGDTSLGKFFVDVANSGEPSFLGVLFNAPVVTSVELILGNAAIFDLDSTNQIILGQGEDIANGIDLVATDDFLYAEPTDIAGVSEFSSFWALLLTIFPWLWSKHKALEANKA